jgi:Rieske Fe-S protein
MDLDVSLSQFVPSVYEELGGDRARVPIFIVNHPQQGFLALHAFDPHLGCRVGLASELPSDIGVPLPEEVVFLNPCHGEKYDLGGGYMAGPAPRGLDRFGVSITDGRVIVDLTDFVQGPPR